MRAGTVAFLVGVLGAQQVSDLPDPLFVQFLPVAIAVIVSRPRLRVPAAFIAGTLWSLLGAHMLLAVDATELMEGVDLIVEGRVDTVPGRSAGRTRFELDLEGGARLAGHSRSGGGSGPTLRFDSRIRISWYQSRQEVHAGERWRLVVRLKRRRGFMNTGGFDYEGWLFHRGVPAVGYVRRSPENRRLAPAPAGLLRWRDRLAMKLDAALGPREATALIKALAIGVRDDISSEQWGVLRATGTSHLMAISGLHVGLVATLAFGLARRLWGLVIPTVPAARVGGIAALLAASMYAGLAGFAIPTQRALVMVAVAVIVGLIRRRVASSVALAWAVLLVLLIDPFAVRSAGFWLSFAAVVVIVYAILGRDRQRRQWRAARRIWWTFGRTHCVLALGLVPALMVAFHGFALSSPVANAVAVPWTSCVVVPLVLVGVVLLEGWSETGAIVLGIAAGAVELLWPTLAWLAEAGWEVRPAESATPWALVAAVVGVAVLLAPRGFPGRWLGVAWLAPLVLIPAPRIAPGALEVSALDVGQGLSVVVRTRDHVMVYDTGPGFPSGFNAGSAVLAPFLATLGIRRIDALVISHQHHDHTGGVGGLRERVGVDRLIANQSNDFGPAQPCVRGLAWRWDGVDFKVLHPEAGSLGDGNEGSCVVQVRGRGGSVLLPGDIERRGERSLVAQYGAALSSDILVAPHHGSATSSSPPLLAAVRPRWAILSRGYRNRFGFPHRAVVARYRRYAIPLLDTAALGAVQFILHADGRVTGPVSHRRSVRRYWHRELESPEVRKKSPEVRKKSPEVRKKSPKVRKSP